MEAASRLHFGALLRNFRLDAGMTQQTLAERAKLSYSIGLFGMSSLRALLESAPSCPMAPQQRRATLVWRDEGSLDGVDFHRDILPTLQACRCA
jgi:hypothetical protein